MWFRDKFISIKIYVLNFSKYYFTFEICQRILVFPAAPSPTTTSFRRSGLSKQNKKFKITILRI